MSPAVMITSFGYLHGRPPAADLPVDLRESYRDPHAVDGLRELTAADPRVTAAVMATPGIPALIGAIAAAVRDLLGSSTLVSVAVGCAGGRHRSAVVADRVARLLEADGVAVAVEHRDIGKPVVARADGDRPLCA